MIDLDADRTVPKW